MQKEKDNIRKQGSQEDRNLKFSTQIHDDKIVWKTWMDINTNFIMAKGCNHESL